MSIAEDFAKPINFLIPSIGIVAAYAIGLGVTIMSTPMPSREPAPIEVSVPELPNPLVTQEITYIKLNSAITSTIPRLRGTVQIETALMMRPGISKKVAERAEQNPNAMVAVMSDAIKEAQIGVYGLEELQRRLPALFADALNDYLGTDSVIEPVQEVLITRLAILQ